LTEAVLTLKAIGENDVKAFRWMEPPETRSLDRALLLLQDLGALDPERIITALGRRMLSFPIHPRYSRMLIAAGNYGCVRAVALIAALTQGRILLMRRQSGDVQENRENLLGQEAESDFFALMRVWQYADEHRYDLNTCRRLGIHAQSARQVQPLLHYFLDIARREGLKIEDRAPDDEAVQKCVLTGFSDQLARRMDSSTLRCQLVHGRKGVLASESAVRKSPLFVAAEVREIEGRERELNVLLGLATAIKEEWLRELFPDDFSEQIEIRYDPETKRVRAARQLLFRDIVLEIKCVDPPPADGAAARLAEEVIKGNLTLKQWDHEVEQWILRVNSLAKLCPELKLPAITQDGRQKMIQRVCLGAVSYKDIKERPVWPAVKSWLSGDQRAMVDKHAPARLELQNGRRAQLTYVADAEPFISLRIQELYDVKQIPKVAMDRMPVSVHILGPNHRPVQITKDLAGFWREHYPRIKREMQRKYPKHEWR
jgi:ATP-dependent helicase HrpB